MKRRIRFNRIMILLASTLTFALCLINKRTTRLSLFSAAIWRGVIPQLVNKNYWLSDSHQPRYSRGSELSYKIYS